MEQLAYILLTAVLSFGTALSAATEPCDADYTAIDAGNICIRLNTTITLWQDAENVCQADGGHVVSLHNLDTNNFVRRLALSYSLRDGIYTGFNSPDGATSSWSDGTDFDYNNFAPGMPNYGIGNCAVLLTRDGTWTSVDCNSRELPYACAKPMNGADTPGTTSSSTPTASSSTSASSTATKTSPSTTASSTTTDTDTSTSATDESTESTTTTTTDTDSTITATTTDDTSESTASTTTSSATSSKESTTTEIASSTTTESTSSTTSWTTTTSIPTTLAPGRLFALFANDFTLNYMPEDPTFEYADVYAEADFTKQIVANISAEIAYFAQYGYDIGDENINEVGNEVATDATAFGDIVEDKIGLVILNGPSSRNSLSTFIETSLVHWQNNIPAKLAPNDVVVVVLFTAAPTDEISAAAQLLPDALTANVVAVGLKGADATSLSPLSVNVNDFSDPKALADVISNLLGF